MTWAPARRVRAAARLGAAPASVGAALALVLVGVLLAADRGNSPMVVVDGRCATFGSAAGALGAATGLIMTWVGLLVVALPVAWLGGEMAGDDRSGVLVCAYGSRRCLLAASFGWTVMVVLMCTIALAAGIWSAGHVLASGAEDPACPHLVISASTVGRLVSATVFWWSVGVVAGRVSRESVVAVTALVGLTVSSLLASNHPATSRYLPTTWLGAASGFERDQSRLTSQWADGSTLGLRGPLLGQGRGGLLVAALSVALLAVVCAGPWLSRERARRARR